jgi:TRAP-type mannitol/chloroaromatic compound transport system permease small subunit
MFGNRVAALAAWLYRWSAVALLSALIAVIVFDVSVRALTGRGFEWSLDVVGLLLLTFFVTLLPHSWSDDAHVRMDIFYGNFAPHLKRWVERLSALGALLFASLIGWRALTGVPYLIETEVSSQTVGIPHWPFSIIVGLCCVLFCLMVLLRPVIVAPSED